MATVTPGLDTKEKVGAKWVLNGIYYINVYKCMA